MTEHEKKHEVGPSRGYIKDTLEKLASLLITKGTIEDNPGVIRVPDKDPPWRFEYALPHEVLRQMFPGDTDIRYGGDSYVAYITPHAADPDQPNKVDGHEVFVYVAGVLDSEESNGLLEVEDTISLWYDEGNDEYFSVRDTDYFKDGQRQTRSGMQYDTSDVLTDDNRPKVPSWVDKDTFQEDVFGNPVPLDRQGQEALRVLMQWLEKQPALTG